MLCSLDGKCLVWYRAVRRFYPELNLRIVLDGTMVTDILIEVLSSIAEQERLTIRKRQREGIEAAKLRGQHMGRPEITMPEKFPAVYENWQEGKITAVYAMEILGLKRSTFYRLVQEYKKRKMSEKDG